MFESTVNTNALLDGLVISNRYEVIRCIGTGAMGSVHLARDRFLSGNIVALKALKKEIAADPKMRKRFLQEVKLMHRVNHHNVVRTYDVGVDHDLIYFTMEYVKGNSLEALIKPEGLEIDRFTYIAMQITAGLGEIHKEEIIHRDLKPANVLISDGKIKIADFGVARSSRSELTQHKEIIGSTPYIAPEIWTGSNSSYQADFYSLGTIFYELLTGAPPFQHELPATIMWMHLKKEPVEPKEIRNDIPQWINSLVLRMLSKEAKNRPESSKEIYRYLRHRSINKSKIRTVSSEVSGTENIEPEIVIPEIIKESVGQKDSVKNNTNSIVLSKSKISKDNSAKNDIVKQSVILQSLASTSEIIKQQEELASKNTFVSKAKVKPKKRISYKSFFYLISLIGLSIFIYFNQGLTIKTAKDFRLNVKKHTKKYLNTDFVKLVPSLKEPFIEKEKKHTFEKVSNLLQNIEMIELKQSATGEKERDTKKVNQKKFNIGYKFKNNWLNRESAKIKNKEIKLIAKDNSSDLVDLVIKKVELNAKLNVLSNKNTVSRRIKLQKEHRSLSMDVKGFSNYIYSLSMKNDLKREALDLYKNLFLLEKAKLKLLMIQKQIDISRKYSNKKIEDSYKKIKTNISDVSEKLKNQSEQNGIDIDELRALKALEFSL